MDRMFRVMAFLCLLMAILAFAGGEELHILSYIFLANTALFAVLSYMGLTEKTLMYIFGAYMFFSFIGITYWSFFLLPVE